MSLQVIIILISATVMIQEIVNVLKGEPFNETMTLMSFDEKRE